MFGYIRPQTGDLFVRELELYRATYCGLCRCGGKKITHLSRFLLDYDFVFLGLTRMAVTGESYTVEKRRCPYHFGKRPIVAENEALRQTAAAFGIFAYYKLIDDIADEHGIRRIGKKIILPLFRRMRRKSDALVPGMDEAIGQALADLEAKEKSGEGLVDAFADSFARVGAIACSFGISDEVQKDILSICGYHIGRYVYLIDAYADCRDDEKKNEFNPFNKRYGSAAETMAHKDEIRLTLHDSMMAFCRAYGRADGCCYDHLIYNIADPGSAASFVKATEKLERNEK